VHYLRRGEPAQAEPLLRRCLTVLEQLRRADSAELVPVLLPLGRILMDQGKTAAAEPLWRARPWPLAEKSADHLLPECLTAAADLHARQGPTRRGPDAVPTAPWAWRKPNVGPITSR